MKKHRKPIGKKKGCPTRKIRYRDHAEAKVALNRTSAKGSLGESRRQERRAYYCSLCAGYHLTSKN